MEKLICYIYDDMADFELTLAAFLGKIIGKEIITIGYDEEKIVSKTGIQYKPHITVKEALELTGVVGLIIPGGWNDEQRPELTALIQKIDREKNLLAAICAGPQYLARAGVLDHYKYTTTLTKESLESAGKEDFFPRENFIPENVIRDGHVITAVGRAFVDFAIEIVDYFNEFTNEEEKVSIRNSYKGL